MMPTIQDTVHALESAVAQAHSETIRETSNFCFLGFTFVILVLLFIGLDFLLFLIFVSCYFCVFSILIYVFSAFLVLLFASSKIKKLEQEKDAKST